MDPVSGLNPSVLEQFTKRIGGELFARIGRGPRPWQRAWWDDRLMNLTLDDPEVKVQLFRFVDALPSLNSARSVRRHLDEYLGEAGAAVPWWMNGALALVPRTGWGDRRLAGLARWSATQMARKFIAGTTPTEVLKTVVGLRQLKMGFTADLLGEAVISEHEAEAYLRTCLDLLEGMANTLGKQSECPQIDLDAHGAVPRLNLSLKLTSLIPDFDALHAERTTARVLERLRPILRTARRIGAFVNVDMEQFAHHDLTYSIVEAALSEQEFRDWPHAGVVVQAYLPSAPADLQRLLEFSKQRGAPLTIRLVKGAYWDYEVIHARQMGWPIPVHVQKWRSDVNFEQCARFLITHHEWLRPAIGSHNVRSLAHAFAIAELLGLPPQVVEAQVLHGMGEPIARGLVDMGRRVRVYTPYGAILPGMAYLVRRLLENTSNDSFLKASFSQHRAWDDLLRNPEEVGTMATRMASRGNPASGSTTTTPQGAKTPFQNEPWTDFTRIEAREAMRHALDQLRGELGRDYPAWIDGRPWSESGEWFDSVNPSEHAEVVGRAPRCGPEAAGRAVESATRALSGWAGTPVEERAAVLQRAAQRMRAERFTLAAWEVLECGKPWRESDADVAEAIDFCDFYAAEMLRLAQPRHRDLPGETNFTEHFPRGVAVVIPPWNFPLAIPMGMTVAALVAGNTVVLKPSEQAPVMGWHLARILRESGLPADALQLVPGFGEAGKALVSDPRVALVAFTGSMEVGLEINRSAALTPTGQYHVKRVIAEMGGKNAILVDDDADLDEAVVGVLKSAFGYAGQKCSACSRAIVLDGVYDAFVARLSEAALALRVGPAADPSTFVGPVIDAEAQRRVLGYQEKARSEGRVVAHLDVGPLAGRGYFVGPMIVADVAPSSPLAQEEIFGPVLAVLRARDLDEALAIANGTMFALTGGVYSRSPAHIDRVKRELRVGNLYINRTITGALVDRQPFGGFRLSGIGTKAGGPDYLLEFLLTRSVCENTMRRGFAPEIESDPLTDDDPSPGR